MVSKQLLPYSGVRCMRRLHMSITAHYYLMVVKYVKQEFSFLTGFLAASPDGIVSSHADVVSGVIEIKCPYSCRDMTVRDACTKMKSFYCQLDAESQTVSLKHSHHYYYQVQGSMAITGAQWCDFIVWTSKDCTIERIPFNIKFWGFTYPYLKTIYHNYILPELVNPRINLGLDIVEYDHYNYLSLINEHEA